MREGSLEGTFGIADIVRRTGLSAPAVRMWEKRYGAVVPKRTATNRRVYDSEDLERLKLLQSLTERGHTISNIANLSLAQLRERLEAEGALPLSRGGSKRSSPKRSVLCVGVELGALLARKEVLDLDLVAEFDDLQSVSTQLDLPEADLVVMATETLFPETLAIVQEIVSRAGAPRAVLTYRFSTSRTAAALARAVPGLRVLAAPISDNQLRRECLLQLESLAPRADISPDLTEAVPESLYTLEQLAKLSRISTTVECECPQHLAGLLQSLAAFEKYSRECEDRNPQDALLHAFLHRTTATVRRTMEEALQHVVEAEGIELDGSAS